MVDMKEPITGTILHVPDERVEKLEKAGYERVEAEKSKRTTRKKTAEN